MGMGAQVPLGCGEGVDRASGLGSVCEVDYW